MEQQEQQKQQNSTSTANRLAVIHRVLYGNVSDNVVQSCTCGIPVSLSLHKFIQVAGKLYLVASPHVLEFAFYLVPVRFNILGVYPSHGINKFHRVIDSGVHQDIRQRLHPAVGTPLVTMNDSAW